MKSQSILRLGKAALLSAGCALFAASFHASATNPYDLSACGIGPSAPGQFSCLSVFTLNANSGDTDILSGNAKIQGAVGVAGSGKITMSNFSRIEGNLSYKTNGTLTKAATATITGTIYKNSNTDSLLNAGVQVANFASAVVDSLNASSGYPTTINSNTSMSLTSTGVAVLKLTDFKLSSNATLTLNGSSSSYFLINVKKNFSLANSSNVVLSGGITWDHVLVNVRGANSQGTTSMSGTSQFNGIILATQRTITMTDSAKVTGAVIANTVNLSGNSVIKCPNVSP